ncbi:MAG TPA: hypothetical protein VFI52_04890 [Gemmatimonadaceae bacterium]|nr:hypothetical protein [Gemmatimonadaceae bacterium]
MMKRRGLAALALACAMVGSAGGRQAPAAQASTPIDPVDLVLASFAQRPLVALAEAHGLEEEHDLIARPLRDPRFGDATSTIVIEWANALYQPTIDRYLAGEEVPLPELRKAWRNTGFSPFAPWDAPVYERFFTVAREVNLSRPPARRMRVVAADPPVDWAAVRFCAPLRLIPTEPRCVRRQVSGGGPVAVPYTVTLVSNPERSVGADD